MRLLLLLLAVLGGFVLFGILVAPYQPDLRQWYIQNACPYLDRLSADLCAPARREAGGRSTEFRIRGLPSLAVTGAAG